MLINLFATAGLQEAIRVRAIALLSPMAIRVLTKKEII